MGLIKAAVGSAKGVLADSWKEMIYCDAIPADVLVVKGQKRVSGRSSNRYGDDNIITNGSRVVVNEGQAMIIVDQGAIVDFCGDAGEYTYDVSSEPSFNFGNFGQSMAETFKQIGGRFEFGGDTGHDQRVYYFNTKEIIGNKYGTANPVPFRVVDQNIGLDVDISVRCNGEYSYKIVNPLLFYKNVCGNVEQPYSRSEIDSQLKSELLTALQPAFAKISAMGVRYSAVPAHTQELADALNDELDSKWRDLRGIEVASFGVNSITASPEDEQMIKRHDAQRRHAPGRDRRRDRRGYEDRRGQRGRRHEWLFRHEHGGHGRRHRDGQPARASRCLSQPVRGGAGRRLRRRRGHLDLPQVRPREHGQVLQRVRHPQAGACARGRRVDLPQVRQEEHGQVLRRLRYAQARRVRDLDLPQVRA